MQYAPSQGGTAAFAIVVNLLDMMVEKKMISDGERLAVLADAESDLGKVKSVGNTDGIKAIKDLTETRYLRPKSRR